LDTAAKLETNALLERYFSLERELPMSDNTQSANIQPAQARIAQSVHEHDVVLFMKGTPLFPQCGFSARAVAILDRLGVQFTTHDVLQDAELRQGIKTFSNWPTIPQLYVKGEFVGGSDIMMEMFEAGELQALMDEKAVARVA
jgi:monothiol glutaredoxin